MVGIPLRSTLKRLTAIVVTLSQIAQLARPSIVVTSGKAYLLPAWS